jgi:hypothetical protein
VKKVILIIDRDLGFVFRLGRTLEAAGHEVLPARSVCDARRLLSEFHLPIDLVVVHRSTPGAYCLVERLRRSQRQINVIGLWGDEQDQLDSAEYTPNGWRPPFGFPWLKGDVTKSECLGTVQGVLAATFEDKPTALNTSADVVH